MQSGTGKTKGSCSQALVKRGDHVIDLMLSFNMLKGFVDVDASEFFECVAPDSVTRGNRYKLVHPSVRINVRQHCFAVRIIPV